MGEVARTVHSISSSSETLNNFDFINPQKPIHFYNPSSTKYFHIKKFKSALASILGNIPVNTKPTLARFTRIYTQVTNTFFSLFCINKIIYIQ